MYILTSLIINSGYSRFCLPMVPARLVFFTCKAVASFREVKKLSVVMFLSFPRNGSISLSTSGVMVWDFTVQYSDGVSIVYRSISR